uniref:Nascent polypeptide-associated complex subunit beta n=1 Tax=Picocystis salinarum TaxID=88271 RepID=A0A6U9QP08_9CHLO|mmetsp:Transcript_2874/g.17894  ORF Transcript_2874/g.17894 Transcript_2874/m.17894 type:complete len:149 (+) Transcript_2874:97-543(+)
MDLEKLQKMAGAVRTGGKGSVRRKKKAVHKSSGNDDKKLQSALKRIGVSTIPGIEEVNIFKEEEVISFSNPKVQASLAANTFVVSGPSQTKSMAEVLPDFMSQLSPAELAQLKQMAQQMQTNKAGGESTGDDDVPDLVEDFEQEAEKA